VDNLYQQPKKLHADPLKGKQISLTSLPTSFAGATVKGAIPVNVDFIDGNLLETYKK